MMPDYQWANGSWGTDVLTYLIYNTGGFWGLTIASAAIVTLTFFFIAKATRFSLFEKALFFPILIYLETFINRSSFRGEQISLLLFSILIYIVSRYVPYSKKLWFIPLLFLLWSNTQIESFLGLAVFTLWIGFTLIKNFMQNKKLQKESIFLSVIFLATIASTLINPFGWNLYIVAISHFNDPILLNITEYVPFSVLSMQWWNEIFAVLLMLFITIYLLKKKQLLANLPFWSITIIFLCLTFAIRRFAWPMYYLAFYFLHAFESLYKPYIKRYALIISFVLSSIVLCIVIFLKMPFNQYASMSWENYCELQSIPCSPDSADYLTKEKLTSNVFTYYDWGGWLIWNYPNIKPTIDGRMHLWRDKNNKSVADEYGKYLRDEKDIDASSYDVIYIPLDRSLPLYGKLSKLVTEEKWKVVYNDDLAAIIVRVKK
jgi:hypothetical protein